VHDQLVMLLQELAWWLNGRLSCGGFGSLPSQAPAVGQQALQDHGALHIQ